jgi:uncharacterized protein
LRIIATYNPEKPMKFSGNALATALALFAVAVNAPAVLCAAEPAAGADTAASSAYVKPDITHEPYGAVNLVVPLTTDDKGIQVQKLRNITNGLNAADAWHGKFTVKLVLYAKGLTLLKDPDEATRKQLDMLRSRGLQIVICNNSMAEQGIDFHTLYHVTEADIVPSGFAEVAFLQVRHHYAVDPVN